jgi:hypothetical protein
VGHLLELFFILEKSHALLGVSVRANSSAAAVWGLRSESNLAASLDLAVARKHFQTVLPPASTHFARRLLALIRWRWK